MSLYLLAAGVGDVLPVLFVLIAIASGLINFFREKGVAQQAKQQQHGRPPGGRDDQVDSEIEMFLEEVTGPDGRERRPQRKRPRRSQRDRPKRKRPQREPEPQEPVGRESVADHHMEVAERSSVGQRHVESHVGERHMPASVGERHLVPGVETAAADAGSRSMSTGKRSPIMGMLQTAGGVRTAIVLNEILSPPPGRRNRS
jgi:hypothetical protein